MISTKGRMLEVHCWNELIITNDAIVSGSWKSSISVCDKVITPENSLS